MKKSWRDFLQSNNNYNNNNNINNDQNDNNNNNNQNGSDENDDIEQAQQQQQQHQQNDNETNNNNNINFTSGGTFNYDDHDDENDNENHDKKEQNNFTTTDQNNDLLYEDETMNLLTDIPTSTTDTTSTTTDQNFTPIQNNNNYQNSSNLVDTTRKSSYAKFFSNKSPKHSGSNVQKNNSYFDNDNEKSDKDNNNNIDNNNDEIKSLLAEIKEMKRQHQHDILQLRSEIASSKEELDALKFSQNLQQQQQQQQQQEQQHQQRGSRNGSNSASIGKYSIHMNKNNRFSWFNRTEHSKNSTTKRTTTTTSRGGPDHKLQQENNNVEEEDWKGVSIPLLPLDTFSYFAFSKITTKAMIVAIAVILVQLTTIAFLLYDTFSSGGGGESSSRQKNRIGVPAGVSAAVSFIQAMTLFIGVFSQTDFQDSLNTLLIGYHKEELKENFGVHVSFGRWLFSLVMRIVVSLLGLTATFFLIMTGNDASDLLLDFTAVEFITNLDNIFFWLTAWGYLGFSAQRDASKLVQAKTLDLVTVDDDDPEDMVDWEDEELIPKIKRRRLLAKRTASFEKKSFFTEEEEDYDDTDYDDVEEFALDPPELQVNFSFGSVIPPFQKPRNSRGVLETIFSADVATAATTTHRGKDDLSSKRSKSMVGIPKSTNSNLIPKSMGDMFHADTVRTNAVGEKIQVRRQCPRFQFLCLIYGILLIGWFFIFIRQKTGYYLCQTVFVQFSDELNPDLSAFTGLYNYRCSNGATLCSRGEYVEEGHGGFQETARFGFCHEMKSWTFSYHNSIDPDQQSSSSSWDPCEEWKVKSMEVSLLSESSFDMLSLSQEEWITKNHIGSEVPMPDFKLKCFDCENDPLFCGGEKRGTCVNNRCVCKEGWHGSRCEFKVPCDRIEIDPRHPSFQGTRTWAEKFDRLVLNSTGVEVYNRPVYISDSLTNPDVVFFNGRRWAITSASSLTSIVATNPAALLANFFENEFHARWTKYSVSFLSTEIKISSPSDFNSPVGVEWFQVATSIGDGEIQAIDPNRPVEARFLCSACSDDNPCLFGGVCNEGVCDCVTGSSGQLCQIPPVGDGKCDLYFNTPEFSYDGGDCCEDTCVSTFEYECGKGVVDNAFGVEAFGFVGFAECLDPKVLSQTAGSRTIFNIKQRGYVKCGLVQNPASINKFEADLCSAIAAAVLDDKEAYRAIWVKPPKRFTGLRDDEYDILMRSDHTVNRDVFEDSSRSNFEASPLSYLYTGLVLGGIPPYPACADRLDYHSDECKDLKICMPSGTTWFRRISDIFPISTIFEVDFVTGGVAGMEAGICNLVGGSNLDVDFTSVKEFGFTGDSYELGNRFYSKSFLSWLTRPDDRVWTKFTSWVLEALVQAEESGVTKDTSYVMKTTTVFGESFKNMFRNAVAAHGNYGELWNKSLPFPRSGWNSINNGTTGLILSNQFTKYNDRGPSPKAGGKIATIMALGELYCGVGERPGFATIIDEDMSTWGGFEVDLCRAIAASLGVKAKFNPLSIVDRFSAVVAGIVDVAFSVTHTLEREIRHPGTGKAFDFSPVYFYDGLTFAGQLPYGKCAADLDFEGDCFFTRICVSQGSTWLDAMKHTLLVPNRNIVISASHIDSVFKLSEGECNAIAAESASVSETSLRGTTGVTLNFTDYYVGSKQYTKEPLAIMSRSDDSQFSDYIRWIVFALIDAEENGIERRTASFEIPLTNLFGPELRESWRNAVAEVGNFAEIWQRNLLSNNIIERQGLNLLNNISAPGPQLWARPGTI